MMNGIKTGGGLKLQFLRELGGVFAWVGAVIVGALLLLPGGNYDSLVLQPAAAANNIADPTDIFAPFQTSAGVVQTVEGRNCTHPDNGAGGADICNTNNPFIQPNFGTAQGNSQDCETCHQPQLGWSFTPQFAQHQFATSRGTAEQFRVNDTVTDPRICGTPTAATTPAQNAANVNACVNSMSFAQKQQAYSLFVNLGLVRLAIKDDPALDDFVISAPTTAQFGSLPIPAGQDSQQPCSVQAPGGVGTCVQTVSVFRRPLLTVNTFFNSSVLWDGRQNVCVEPTPPPGVCPAPTQPIRTPLLSTQVSGAAQTLLLSAPPTLNQRKMAAHFMTGLFTGMRVGSQAGDLTANGATGGPQFLADMASGKAKPPCTPLVEASVANSGAGLPPPNCTAAAPLPATPPNNGRGFNLFINFLPSNLRAAADTPAGIQAIFAFCNSGTRDMAGDEGQIAVACGENIFNNHPLNEPDLELPNGTVHPGRDANNVPVARCTTCHAAQNVGVNPDPSFVLPIGISQPPDDFVGGDTEASGDPFCETHPGDRFCQSTTFNLPKFKARASMLPLYTLTQRTTGESIQLTDPGQALITHRFDQAGAMKPPQLRALAVRGPFFHNGVAETLDDVVDFYNQNFSIGLTPREHHDLVAFLKAL